MPILREFNASELNWDFDFSPQRPWTSILPVLAVIHQDRFTVIAGFDRKKLSDPVSVLVLDGAIENAMNDLYSNENLLPLERLRFNKIFEKIPEHLDFLTNLPIELQNFLDQRQVPLKALKPLTYLKDWIDEIFCEFLKLNPSSSQVRESLDLLCDLKLKNYSWAECAPKESREPQKWLTELFKLRNPNLTKADTSSARLIENAPWPRGVRAKWERLGDQGGVTIQARVLNPREFQNFKHSLLKVELEEKLWNP